MDHRRALRLAKRPSIVRRGLKFSAIVGTILVLINHGDRLIRGEFDTTQGLQVLLTYVVPYIVSCLSSVQSLLESEPVD